MPSVALPNTPAWFRAASTPKRTIGTCTAAAATDLFTLTSGNLNALADGDIVRIAGTLTGGAGISTATAYGLEIVSSTTFKLHTLTLGVWGAVLDVTSDLTAGGSLTYGEADAGDGILAPNIVSQNSVAGGAAQSGHGNPFTD